MILGAAALWLAVLLSSALWSSAIWSSAALAEAPWRSARPESRTTVAPSPARSAPITRGAPVERGEKRWRSEPASGGLARSLRPPAQSLRAGRGATPDNTPTNTARNPSSSQWRSAPGAPRGSSTRGGSARQAPVRGGPEAVQTVAAQRVQPVPEATIGRSSGALAGLRGVSGDTIPPIRGRLQGCGIAQPLRVRAVDGVRLSPPAVMDADTARALADWVARSAKPALGRQGGGISELRVAAGYSCRTRNHRKGARISEHGKGKAIDISAITLRDGTVISVASDYRKGRYAKPLKAMHRAACGRFGTTLGPGSDGMHEDHLHFDTARHANGPYCR